MYVFSSVHERQLRACSATKGGDTAGMKLVDIQYSMWPPQCTREIMNMWQTPVAYTFYARDVQYLLHKQRNVIHVRAVAM